MVDRARLRMPDKAAPRLGGDVLVYRDGKLIDEERLLLERAWQHAHAAASLKYCPGRRFSLCGRRRRYASYRPAFSGQCAARAVGGERNGQGGTGYLSSLSHPVVCDTVVGFQ